MTEATADVGTNLRYAISDKFGSEDQMTMTTNTRSRIYIGAAAAAALSVVSLTLWNNAIPSPSNLSALWLIPTLAILAAIAGRFPIKLSSQTEASLFTVPLFMAVLLLHPSQAVIVAVLGTTLSEFLMKAPTRAVIFNVSVNGLATGLAGLTFWTLRPETTGLSLTTGYVFAVAESGLLLHLTNALMVVGMVVVTRGTRALRHWKGTYVYEAIQDGGMLTLGFMGALLIALAWWGLALLVIPFLLAYYGFRRSVGEVANSAKLNEDLDMAHDILERSIENVVEKTRLVRELEEKMQELKEVQAQLIQSAKLTSVGTLATGIAHEVNNPLFVITATADYLLKNTEEYLPNQMAVQSVETMRDMGMRISDIVRHLLDYARPSEVVEDVLLADVLDSSLVLLGGKKKVVNIETDYHDEPAVVEGVSSQLQQVFINLIGNAIDATPEQGTITIRIEQNESDAVVRVTDTGFGIPEDIKKRLFEPFFTTKEVGEGTGLGLFICHKIVSTHHGKISVESAAGKGTTFSVTLPLYTGVKLLDLDNILESVENAALESAPLLIEGSTD